MGNEQKPPHPNTAYPIGPINFECYFRVKLDRSKPVGNFTQCSLTWHLHNKTCTTLLGRDAMSCYKSLSERHIDSIGVPQGVPNEHKARNQIAGGFVHILPWIGQIIEMSKNTDWINYIYYNQQ